MKGRINIVDLAALIVLLAILPLAYGASLLFQPSRPQITEVGQVDITNAERRIVAGGSLLSAKLKIKGTGFNPMLRAYIGDQPALAFVYENPNSADVLVGPLPPGAHDLMLLDGIQEVARARGVVKIESPSSRFVRASGWLTNMDAAVAKSLQVATTFPPPPGMYQLIALGPIQPARSRIRFGNARTDVLIANRVERQAVVLMRCDPTGEEFRTGQEPCAIGGQGVYGEPPITVALASETVTIGFSIEELFPTSPPRKARIAVRVASGGNLVNIGDRDALLDERAAVVAARSGEMVTLEVGLDESREGWRYRGRLLRVGSDFSWANDRYEATGTVLSMNFADGQR
jgi:hypothetical protein